MSIHTAYEVAPQSIISGHRRNLMPRHSSTLLDHFNSPRNAGKLDSPTIVGEADRADRAPRVTIYLQIAGERISQASFTAFGCGVTIACCSVLTVLATGRSVHHCRDIEAADIITELGGVPAGKQFCASVAVAALRDALGKFAE